MLSVIAQTVRMITKPKQLCTPVDMNLEGIFDAETQLLCYEVHELRGEPRSDDLRFDLWVNNPFGDDQAYQLKRPKTVCLPSTIEIVD